MQKIGNQKQSNSHSAAGPSYDPTDDSLLQIVWRQKRLIGVTTLEAIATAAMAGTGAPRAATIHDARREEAYLLLKEGDAIILLPVVLPFAEAIARIKVFGPCAVAGTGAASASESLGEGFVLSPIRQPDALWVARLARTMPVPESAPGPLYLRAPDAKLPGGKALV